MGPRNALEPEVRRFLAGRTRGYLLRLIQDRAFALAAAAALLAAGRACAEQGIELSAVALGDGGFVMNGIDPNDFSGFSVSGAGDVNGDGLDDVVIGAYGADPAGKSSAGESYVVFGTASGSPIDLFAVAGGTGGFVINGIDPNDFSGFSVSGAGDVNGDGLDDVIIGAWGADQGGNANAGESYVVFGKADGSPVNLSAVAAGSGGFVINGIDPDDRSGTSVSGAGDVNGDGLDDVIVGAWFADPGGINLAGESYVVFGKADGSAVNLSAVAAGAGGFVINGADPFDESGFSVSGAGDVNGDGLDDVIVGAWLASLPGHAYAGTSSVVFGKADGRPVNLSDVAAGIGGFVINGDDPFGYSGSSVSGAGDVNGDGLADVIVGAPNADAGSSDAGESYVVFGKADGTPVELIAVAGGAGGFVINGKDPQDRSGSSVSGAGDVNQDGFDDVIVGAPFASPTGFPSSKGESYVVLGKADGMPVDLASVATGIGGLVIRGIDNGDRSGSSVGGAGDVDGDGKVDFIVGAPGADPAGDTSAGESYVVLNVLCPECPGIYLADVAAGMGGFGINGIDPDDRSGQSVSGAGDVNGDGLDDVIVGASEADPGGNFGAGESYVVFGKADEEAVFLSAVAGGAGGFIINGIDTGDDSGTTVSGAGDVNGDGLDDVIVGAEGADPDGKSFAGESYVVFGKADGMPVDLSSVAAGNGGFVIIGIDAFDHSGGSVSGAGDVNGDALDDVVVGASGGDPAGINLAGESYVVFGKIDGTPVSLSDVTASTGGYVINGVDPVDSSGGSVSGAGDVNGDGLDDVIVGAWSADPAGNNMAGESYVVFGKADGTPVSLAAVAAGAGGFVITGIDPSDNSGISVSGAGDVNGDGLDDVIVGSNAGESYVVFGKADGGSVDLSAIAAGAGGFIVYGFDPYPGFIVSGAGDVNADGLHDLIVAAQSGGFVVLGKADGTPVDLSAVAEGIGGFVMYSLRPGDVGAVSGAGDVDGDGADDVVLGAPGVAPGGIDDAGQSYVVFSPFCPWDCDGSGDGVVNVQDLLALLAQYDPISPADCDGGSCDYDDDGCVSTADLLNLLAHYNTPGASCP